MISDKPLPYRLIRSRKRKKTLSLMVTGKGDIVVQAPYATPAQEIDAFFARKREWLEEKLRQIRERPALQIAGPPADGNTLFYLGKSCPVILRDTGVRAELFTLSDGRFILDSRIHFHRKAIIRAWYEGQAASYIPKRVDHYGRSFGLQAAGIRISRAQNRWGSCSAKNVLAFAWRLMMAPPAVIDYVVVHELAHIREKNHSRSFWSFVASIMPDYAAQRQWLKIHGHELSL